MTRDDAGFSLPELLVAMVVTAVIMPPLVAAFVTGVRTTAGTTERLSASNGATLVSTWFVPDVQSADSVLSADAPTCPSPGNRLFTTTYTSAGKTVITGYATALSGTETRLVRYACTDGTPDAAATLGYTLDPAVPPLVTCTPNPCGPATTHVSVTVTDATGYSFELNAQRRKS